MIKREDLPRGEWRFEQSQMRMVSRGGLQYQLGQKIMMQVQRIDFAGKFIDFRIAGEKGEDTPKVHGAPGKFDSPRPKKEKKKFERAWPPKGKKKERKPGKKKG
jgi:hypothetical protein